MKAMHVVLIALALWQGELVVAALRRGARRPVLHASHSP